MGAYHPTMRPLHHPPPRLGPCLPLQFLRLFPTRLDVGREAELCHDLTHLVVVIALVQAHPLRLLSRRLGTLDGNALQGFADHLHVVAVGALHGQAHRDAVGLDQQAALGAFLGAVGGVFARLFPPRGAPWSCTRPCSARTSRGPSGRHRPSGQPPTYPGRRRPRPTPGSGHGLSIPGRTWWRREPSIGSRCGGRRGWRSCRRGLGRAAGHRRSGACSCVRGSAGRWPPKGRRRCTSHRG